MNHASRLPNLPIQPLKHPTTDRGIRHWTGYQWFVFISSAAWRGTWTAPDQQLFQSGPPGLRWSSCANENLPIPRIAGFCGKTGIEKPQQATTDTQVIAAQQNADIGEAAGWARRSS